MTEGAGDSRVSYISQAGDLVLVRRGYVAVCCPGRVSCKYEEIDDWDWDETEAGNAHDPEYEHEPVEVIRVIGSAAEREKALAIFHGGKPIPSLTEQIHAASIPTRERLRAVAS